MIFVLVLGRIRWFIASPTYLYPLWHILAFSDDRWVSLHLMELHGELLRNICPSEECRGLIISRFCGDLFHCTRLKPLSSPVSICFPVSKVIRHPAAYGYGELLTTMACSQGLSLLLFCSKRLTIWYWWYHWYGDLVERRSLAWTNESGCCNDPRCKLWALASNISHFCIWKQVIFRRCIAPKETQSFVSEKWLM